MKKSLTFLLFSFCSFNALASENFSDHEIFCSQQPQALCLDYINQQLAVAEPGSARWYEIKSYQFDYFYDKMEYLALKDSTEPFINGKDLPVVFQVQVYFYYAKSMQYFGNHEQGRKFATLAFENLQAIFDSFGNPMRMVELANLQYVFGNKETALHILDRAERRFGKSKDPIFHFELASNKANVFHSLGDVDGAIASRRVAVDWILKTNHKRKISVALGNLARTYQILAQYDEADKLYVQSLKYIDVESDRFVLAIYKLRLAEINWQAGKPEQALKWFKQVHKGDIRKTHAKLYAQLENVL
ncbi:tetratricopeptide repeat protein [Pseudoalteromonas sp. APAL1]|jgi:tetratricopeptide (TPR) repeat protein|uniref:tetratricopeptide repeat protein n=1 Tax=unclassified Pseudoalteromonas TaxID=194690 RepID=UPI000EE12242|nr:MULTISPECIES: tetratricopeptide repeat protein [unclassified Pseudoalteromonas]MCF2919675.1 tetratricopeptide repeat protein [Pseudoalteromonas sp. APAL1]HCV05371.1 hypothetical protein [Pseudoalteromonas sp.]|tara:strand:+ start:15 stop:920 length:906 start_codon:yes stop_codon:yes gene_type:complete